MRRAQVLLAMALVPALWLAGCATVPPDRTASATGNETSAVSSTKAQVISVLPPAIPCPPSGPDIIERDLTIPWDARAYLTEDGRLCRPGIAP